MVKEECNYLEKIKRESTLIVFQLNNVYLFSISS